MSEGNSLSLGQAQAFAQMTTATQAIARQFERTLSKERLDTILVRHELGRQLDQIISEEATYGSAAVEQLAAYLALSPDFLYKLHTYSQLYDREQVGHWAERRMSNGAMITFNHLTTIMAVTSEPQRRQLVERIFEESLSVRDLRVLLRRARDSAQARSEDGTKLTTPLRGLNRLIAEARKMFKALPAHEEAIFAELDIGSVETPTLDPAVRSKLQEVQVVLTDLSDGLGAVSARARQIVEHT
jgi:hypothetical protein